MVRLLASSVLGSRWVSAGLLRGLVEFFSTSSDVTPSPPGCEGAERVVLWHTGRAPGWHGVDSVGLEFGLMPGPSHIYHFEKIRQRNRDIVQPTPRCLHIGTRVSKPRQTHRL